jgi:hypothetical protein
VGHGSAALAGAGAAQLARFGADAVAEKRGAMHSRVVSIGGGDGRGVAFAE